MSFNSNTISKLIQIQTFALVIKINKHDEYDTMGKKRLEIINGFRRVGEEEEVVGTKLRVR